MGKFTKGIDLVRRQESRFLAMQMTALQGHEDMALQALQDGKELTSGTLTKSQTRGAFARGASPTQSGINSGRRNLTDRQLSNRGLKGQAPLLPINIQSGQLNRSIQLKKGHGRGIQSFDLTEEDPGGGIFRLLPGGTRKMVSSGYFLEIKRRWRARNQAFVQVFVRKQRTP